ncbi:hypothetical protein GCK72_011246 [Caenorhabditis remanei]|uniref:Nuclear receptor domain-containing protein n=1 Tax=Caenorhabditis remanei TaxID=31234 RepID=A0A6A5H7Z3_CAERE|nr:hypothetical protein GCK72_011246 [Caenorhabditis remanei]KAF1762981.1 hypothetical protein GCK72_011246 [Caenorhabditis remanei]
MSDNAKICLICGRTAYVRHYGVLSCEACKMFFRRIVLGNKNYKCTLPNKEFCEKNILKCKGCRFEKCKRLGMYLDIADIGRTEESRTKQMEGENKDLLELLENLKKLDTLKTAINPDEFSSQFPTMLYFLNCNIIQILGAEDKTQILKYNRRKLGYFIGVMVLLNKTEPDLMMYSNDGWNKDLELVGHMASMKISHEEYLLLILLFPRSHNPRFKYYLFINGATVICCFAIANKPTVGME